MVESGERQLAAFSRDDASHTFSYNMTFSCISTYISLLFKCVGGHNSRQLLAFWEVFWYDYWHFYMYIVRFMLKLFWDDEILFWIS